MTAPMAPEELAAIEERYHRIGAPDDAVLRLLAEVRRLQTERDAAPPVGQTVEQAISHLEHVVTTYNEHPTALSLTRVAQARDALLRAITARDAEVARAAAHDRAIAEAARALWRSREWLHLTKLGAWPEYTALRDAIMDRSHAPAPAEKEG